jgi:hypothetical protein
LTLADKYGRMKASQGEMTMSYDFEDVNAILSGMVDDGMVEPIDDPNLEVNFWDWADVVGVVDEFVPVEYI